VSTKEAVTILSRALAVFFLAWLLSDLTYLPSYIFAFLHHENTLSGPSGTYLRNLDFISLLFLLLRIAVLFFAVQWFYRAGPAIQEYFLTSSEEGQPGL
jgi:hypothetical protein